SQRSALPAADAVGTLDLETVSGKVALAPSTMALGCGGAIRCGKDKVFDLVGYGAASDFEGANQRAPALDATKAAIRKGDGCTDTDDTGADFPTGTPTPRNSASTPKQCPTPPGASQDAAANPPSFRDPMLPPEDPLDAGVRRDAASDARSTGSDSSD